MDNRKYALHSHTTLIPLRKPGHSPTYSLNPTHGDVSVADGQFQNNLHNYHLFKKMNLSLKKITFTAIDGQWTKGSKYMEMGYENKFFIKFMDWIYGRYDQITPGYLMRNQDKMKATYKVKDPI